MNVIILFNKKKHQINIHKLDSILCIKNKINKIIFQEKYELNDIEIYYENKVLNNNDCCDKYNIKDKNILNVHLKKKGGNIMKKILWVLGCIIIILIPFFILPTGINTSGVSFASVVMGKVKDGFSRYLLCELKYKTLVKRLGSALNFLKYILFILATYVLITIGCVTACLLVKGKDLEDDPQKICSPYYVGSVTGLILTSIYFFIYFMLRYSDKILVPLENYSKKNFITNTLFLPLISGLRNFISKFKFVIVYIMPVFGMGVKSFHTMIDLIFPQLVLMIQQISSAGCSPNGLNNILKNMKGKFNDLNSTLNNSANNSMQQIPGNIPSISGNMPQIPEKMPNIPEIPQSGGGNNNNNNPNNTTPKKKNTNNWNNASLYNIQFNNGIIDNSKYQEELNILREAVIVNKDPLCKDFEGSCCNRNMMETIANAFYDLLMTVPTINATTKEYNIFFGVNLACIGMYEYVLTNDDLELNFNGKNIVEQKILLRQIFEQKKEIFQFDKNGKKNNSGIKLLDDIEKIVVSPDEYLQNMIETKDFDKLKKNLFDYIHKDDLDPSDPASRQKIEDIYKKIATLEAKNIEYAEKTESKYQTGNTIEKTIIKKIFINIVCNLFQNTKSIEDIVDDIGGLNELMDIMKCGSGAGVIMSLIYIITVIVLMICGFLGIF
jgi:hypothetical protein